MFKISANVGDLKRIFGMVGCSYTNANISVTESSLFIESGSHIDRFSRARIMSCSGLYNVHGDIMLSVSTKKVLSALLSARSYEIADISYDGVKSSDGNLYLIISVCNVSHDIPIIAHSDINRSGVIGKYHFDSMQRVSGKVFSLFCKSSHDSGSNSIVFSNTDSVFSMHSVDGDFVSHVNLRSDMIRNISASFSADYLYRLSKFIRYGDDLTVRFGDDFPVEINFGLNAWNIDYLIAPVICYGGD